MTTKRCNHCNEVKSIEEFNWRYRHLGERQRTCRSCQNTQKASWYKRNKDRHKANMYQNKLEKVSEGKELIYNHLMTHPCVDCGETDIRVLEFDHVRGSKKDTVMNMVRGGYSIRAIRAEISKCVVRCANCHKKKTYRNSWRDQ